MLTVRIVERPEEWAALTGGWEALLAASPTDSVFLTHEWLGLWWQCFGSPEDRLYVAAAFRDGQLCAIAPLRWRCERSAGLRLRLLRSLTNEHTPKYDWLWRPGDAEAITALLDAICRRSDWDVLRLDYVPADSATVAALLAFGLARRLRTSDEWCISSPYITIRGTWDEYEASLSDNFGSKTRKAERRLRKAGRLNVVEVRGGPGLKEALRRAYVVEQSSWKGAAGSAIADRPHEERFYTELAAAASARGWFRLFFLELDGRPIAFHYCFDYKRTMYSVKIGYDPAFARYSPGTVLKWLILKPLFEQRTHDKFDMLGAVSGSKLRWSKEVQDLRSVCLFARGLRGRLAYELQVGVRRRLEHYPRLREAAKRIKTRMSAQRNAERKVNENA
ncbi:MAG: GNAT family N-acetyltransferase [Phycisphaerae bacterium]